MSMQKIPLRKKWMKNASKRRAKISDPTTGAIISALVSAIVSSVILSGTYFLFTQPRQLDVLQAELSRNKAHALMIETQTTLTLALSKKFVAESKKRTDLIAQVKSQFPRGLKPVQHALSVQFLKEDAETKGTIIELKSDPIVHEYLSAFSEQIVAEDKIYTMLAAYEQFGKPAIHTLGKRQELAEEAKITAQTLGSEILKAKVRYDTELAYQINLIQARIDDVKRHNLTVRVLDILTSAIGACGCIFFLFPHMQLWWVNRKFQRPV